MVFSPSNTIRVRDKYTSRACNECQRRKRRCSGEKSCRNCRHWGTDCIFTEPRGSKVWRNSTLNVASTNWPNAAASEASSGTTITRDGAHESEATNTQPDIRNVQQQQQPSVVRTQTTAPIERTTIVQLPSPVATAEGLHDNLEQAAASSLGTELSLRPESVFDRNTNFMTSASFFQQIDYLDRVVSRTHHSSNLGQVGTVGNSTPAQSIALADLDRDIDQTIEQIRSQGPTKIYTALDIFFANVQPHYPCINEAHLRTHISAFIANDTNCLTKNGAIQIASLVGFIMAVVKILSNVSAQDDELPGWNDFCRGEKLLTRSMWLEDANIVTVQTLLIKTLYFSYAALLNSAYDTMGTTVRLCFHLGLHNESSWGDDCKFYDRTYRQRVFWAVFCLNQNVAQTRGVPELLRESDVNVGLPKCVDDRMLYPTCPELPEMPRTCPVPYLLEIIKLTRLSSEAWEAVFGVQARPLSEDVIATLDAKIIELSQGIPPFLRWSPVYQPVDEGAPAFLHQQAFILHLRILQLRMLLRREEMISLGYSKKATQLCIELATAIVTAIEAFNTTQCWNRCRRHAYLHHLTGAIVPLVSIILRQSKGDDSTQSAAIIFNRALKILESFSQGFFPARRILQRLRRPVQAARDISGAQGCQDIPSVVDQAQNTAWNMDNVNNIGSDADILLSSNYTDSMDLWGSFTWIG